MNQFENRVAVITGAASGIGRALAERCLQEGMKVVLADIETDALARTEAALQASGAALLAVPTDVSRAADMEALLEHTLSRFGGVHLLFNNAGVGAGGAIWESTLAEWEWVLGVNLWGVIHGLRLFVPHMLQQGTDGHIVNSASLAGLLPYHPSAPYQVTKQAIVALSEQLYYSLKQRKARIGVSVLCPGVVRTRIMESGRNRPLEAGSQQMEGEASPLGEALRQRMQQATERGMPPEVVAEYVFEAIAGDKFYILTHPEFNSTALARVQHALEGRPPPELYRVIAYCLRGG